MNQILDHSGPKKAKLRKNYSDTLRIIRVYAILIIIFAICFITKGTYSMVKNKNASKGQNNLMEGPQIVLKADEDLLTIEVSYNSAIEEVSYQWYRGNLKHEEIEAYLNNPKNTENDKEDDEVEEEEIKMLGHVDPQKGTGENFMKLQNIGIPKGDSTIQVIVRAQNNVTAKYSQAYHTDVGVDKIAPEINVKLQGKKAIVTATDETEISNLIYSVNNKSEVDIDKRLDKNTIKTEIELDDAHENKINISAVDKAKNTGSYSKTIDLFAGMPKIEFEAEPDYSKIYVTVSYPRGIKKIECEFNGEHLETEIDKPSETKEFKFPLECKEGHNIIKVKALTEEEQVYAEETGECDYNP